MNIVQQLLNSNVRTGGTSSRFKFVSRSPRFSAGSSDSSTNFSKNCDVSYPSRPPGIESVLGRTTIAPPRYATRSRTRSSCVKSEAEGGFSSSDSSSKEFGLQVRSEPVDRIRSKNQSSETSKLKTSEQTFKTTEKQVQQASRSKDVIIDKADVKRDDVKTKTASNSRTDKLASFETNSARAVDAS